MAEKKKYWKYEVDCKRVDALITDTLQQGGVQPWADCARMIMVTLRLVRPKVAPLVLHFIGISAKELLSDRADSSRLCLNVAFALVNKQMMKWQMQLFCRSFSHQPCAAKCQVPGQDEPVAGQMPPPEVMNMFHHIMQSAAGKIMKLPEGVSELEVAPGVKVQVFKKYLGPGQASKKGKAAKSLPPPSRWN